MESANASGKLVIVPTPIGNLGDMTLRSLEALREADVVCAEDTRVTGKLLAHFGIEKRLVRLDEATASLDIENELAVKEAIANLLAKRKTVVMVAHTLAIVRGADSIAVVGDGRVLEQGTHDELVAAGGKYARMWAADRELA